MGGPGINTMTISRHLGWASLWQPSGFAGRGVMSTCCWFLKTSALTFAWLAALTLIAVWSTAAVAQFTPKDGQVLGRTLGFVGDGASGVLVVGIVVSGIDPASQRDADAIRAIVGSDLPAGRIRLQVRLVPVEQLNSVTDIAALYVTAGLAASMDRIAQAAQRLHVPTISADLVCVQSRGCVIGYATEPTVQIVIDKGQAERTGVHFMQAFRMLVREQ
jgi:hypothetical protein